MIILLLKINCDFTSEIILEEDFNAINTSNYGIIEVELNGDCMGINIRFKWLWNRFMGREFITVQMLFITFFHYNEMLKWN